MSQSEITCSASETVAALTEFISDDLLSGHGPETIAPDENLLVSGLVDSIGMMRLVTFVDERFGYSVPPEDVTIENFVSIQAIADYIGRART